MIPPSLHPGQPGVPCTSVSEALAAFLSGLGVEVAYGIVGGSIVPLCSALARSRVRVLQCRHESGAAFAALEESLAKDRPTVVFATAGPGITNAITGLYAARVEGAKVLLVSGGTSPSQRERGASQETTARTLPHGLLSDGPLFHYATTVEHPSQLPAVLRRLTVGMRAVEGFVAHIHLPMSVQSAPFEGRALADCVTLPGPAPSADALEAVAKILTEERCALWVGFGARTAAPLVRALAERRSMPVMCSPRAKGIFPEDHPLFIGITGVGGHAQVASCMQAAEVRRTLVLGTRLWECTSFWRPDLVPPGGFIHVDVNPAVFGAAYPATEMLGVEAEIGAFLSSLLPRLSEREGHGPALPAMQRTTPLEPLVEGPIRPRFLFEAIQRVVVESSEAAVITEAGNAFVWGSHVLRFQEPGRYRSGLHFGSMGHATTGVVGLAHARGRTAVAIVGDGSMLMLEEVSTAVHYGIPAVWVVLNDSRYGIVDHGMRASGYDPVETALPDTDFVLVARGMGAHGVRIERETDLEEGLWAALAAGKPFVLDVRVDPEERPPITSRVRSLDAQSAAPKEGFFS